MKNSILIFFFISTSLAYCQLPFHYKVKNIHGILYDKDSNAIEVDFHSRRKLRIENCKDKEIDTFLHTLTLASHGRRQLEFLLSSSSKITIDISDKTGIMFKDGKYRLMAAMTGPENHQSGDLIINKASETIGTKFFNRDKFIWVYKEATIEIFTGTLNYAQSNSIPLSKENVKLFDWTTNSEITSFSMDTIKIEELMYPDMMYKNKKELYYFAGLHEIFHNRPENIKLQLNKENAENDAIVLETKAFKKRRAVNRRGIRIP